MGKKATMKGSGCGLSRMRYNVVYPEPDPCEVYESLVTMKENGGTMDFNVIKTKLDESYHCMYNDIHKKFINDNSEDLTENLYKPLAMLGDYMGYSENINRGLSSAITTINPPITIDDEIMNKKVKAKRSEEEYGFNLYTFVYYVLTYYNAIKRYNQGLTTHVYHGTCAWHGVIIKGSIITLKSFLSTSLNISVAMSFTEYPSSSENQKTVLAIEGVATSYINLGNVVDNEILLPIGSQLEITNIKEKNIQITTTKFNNKTQQDQIQIKNHESIRVIECKLISENKLISDLLRICTIAKTLKDYIAQVDDDGDNFFDPDTDKRLSPNMKQILSWRYENIWKHISKSCKEEPRAIAESTEPPNKQRRTDPKPSENDKRKFYELDEHIAIITQSAGGGKQSIGKMQFQCTPANKVKIHLSTAHKLHTSLGFKNDMRLLGKERTIHGNKRQYILITPNEAKKLHQRWLKRQ